MTTLPNLPFYDVLRTVAPYAASYLEVGVQEGGSLRAVMETHSRLRTLALCDTWGTAAGGTGRGNHQHIQAQLDEARYVGTVHWLDGRSADVLPGLFDKHGHFDLALVDGSHKEEDTREDLMLVYPHASVMVVHDIKQQPVWKAVCDWWSAWGGRIDHFELSLHGQGTLVAYKYKLPSW